MRAKFSAPLSLVALLAVGTLLAGCGVSRPAYNGPGDAVPQDAVITDETLGDVITVEEVVRNVPVPRDREDYPLEMIAIKVSFVKGNVLQDSFDGQFDVLVGGEPARAVSAGDESGSHDVFAYHEDQGDPLANFPGLSSVSAEREGTGWIIFEMPWDGESSIEDQVWQTDTFELTYTRPETTVLNVTFAEHNLPDSFPEETFTVTLTAPVDAD